MVAATHAAGVEVLAVPMERLATAPERADVRLGRRQHHHVATREPCKEGVTGPGHLRGSLMGPIGPTSMMHRSTVRRIDRPDDAPNARPDGPAALPTRRS